jgi:cytochrome c biogenesis protein CcdA
VAAYVIGKSSVLVALTVVTVAGGQGLATKLKAHAHLVTRASAWMLIVAGLYMTWYFGRSLFLGA